MHCTTFYSYKGGVGRTLALANVASHLAMRGKKVLVVDFDLEAPGITTLDFCAEARQRPGVVDFIHAYLRDGSAPNVCAFIHRCGFTNASDGAMLELHVMPAGDQSAAYGESFAKIDWRELYEERDGFLLIEDLREQWANLGYDYVLIDSRTGLTDVSGVCTRQLPDSVVTLFFPNEQNLAGLTDMVRSIRTSKARPHSPELLFVASRLPRLDDEDGVLERWLERFKSQLAYSGQQFCALHQYDSLALLDQDIFVLSRPKTGLAKQYRKLGGLIAQLNTEDADGALDYIKSVVRLYSGKVKDRVAQNDLSNPFSFERHEDRLKEIELQHRLDCVIQRHLADHYYALRDFARLEVVLRHGLSTKETRVEGGVPGEEIPRLHLLQMKIGTETGDLENAVEAALNVLRCDGANEQMVVEALMVLVTTNKEALPPPDEIAFFQMASPNSVMGVMRKFGISSREADYNCKIALHAKQRFGSEIGNSFRSSIELALIAGGEFEEALAMLGDSRDTAELAGLDVSDAFNRVMALWGLDGKADITLFQALLPLISQGAVERGSNANYQQCLGLIYAVLGEVEACHTHIDCARVQLSARSGLREVSCWSFVEEPEDDFLEHCAEIEKLAKGADIGPLFIARKA
jgi:MinD-like ATPase involved in chromosome partitioning or flagellar assembly